MEPLAAGDPRQVGAYRLHSRLGAGGMGRVYLGFSPAGRAVAVKVIHPELARDPEFLRRFRREVSAAEAVSGAYTAPVVAAGPDDDPPWLATAFVPGPSLTDVVAEAGPLPDAAVWRLAGGLIEALAAVHARGLVHRDLKPSNVLIAADGPRVIDFGISRALDATSMTSSQQMTGTPAFMSPEQAQGLPVGPSADVFALGSVIAYAATGTAPFGGGEPIAVAYRVVHAEPDLSGVPGRLRELVAACLAKDSADRPPLSSLLAEASDAAPALAGASAASFWPEPVASVVAARQGDLRAWVSGTDAADAVPDPAQDGFVLVGTVSAGRDAGRAVDGLDDVTTLTSLLRAGSAEAGQAPDDGAELADPVGAEDVAALAAGAPAALAESLPGGALLDGGSAERPERPGRRRARRAAYVAVAALVIAVASVATGISLLGTSNSPQAQAGARPGSGTGASGPGLASPGSGRDPGKGAAGPGSTSRPAPAGSATQPGRRHSGSPAPSGRPSPSPTVVSAPGQPAPGASSSAALTVSLCVQPSAGCAGAGGSSALEIEPSELTLTVAGVTDQVTGIAWTDWGSATATGTGTLVKSSCLLSCRVPVTITVGSPQVYAAGEEAYSTLRVASASTLSLLTTIVTGLVP